MKVLTITALLCAFLATACLARVTDHSLVYTQCPKCSSHVNMRVSVAGVGRGMQAERWARQRCSADCAEGTSAHERIALCGRLCGFSSVYAFQTRRYSGSKTCSLCGGDVGKYMYKCRASIDSLVSACKRSCHTSTPFEVPDPLGRLRFITLVFSSVTVTNFYPRSKNSC